MLWILDFKFFHRNEGPAMVQNLQYTTKTCLLICSGKKSFHDGKSSTFIKNVIYETIKSLPD